MNANYRADMYLTPNDLNQVENKIDELTSNIQEHIFNNTSSLRNIRVDDDLHNITLYLSFPRTAYEDISQEDTGKHPLVITDSNNTIFYQYNNESYHIGISIENNDYIIYGYNIDNERGNPYLNCIRFKLPKDFGTVTTIYDDDPLYQYIKIYENKEIMPDYVKKQWVVNEIPYMQAIDNIENGIKNLGDYFTKPIGWITTREWLKTNSVHERSDYNVGSKGFSYQDINRWIHNLNLIEQEDMDDVTIWNTNKTQYYWNEEDDG